MRNTTNLIWLLVALILIALATSGMTGMMGGAYGGMPWPGMMRGWSATDPGAAGGGWVPLMVVGMLGMLAFWGAIAVGIVLLARWLLTAGGTPTRPDADEPLVILQRRYAAGEIDQATFERIRRDIGEPTRGGGPRRGDE